MPIAYFNIHKICKDLKVSSIPKIEALLELIRDLGYKASRTHFDFLSIKTNMELPKLKKLILNIQK